ncbi:unnamed protein product [Brachionus calyciflorus]|uniref:Uncharacterized protein n=1 Tax=Brachionus calyciflorus TaxID=104777 RepID=A0A814T2H3_9BILA|nr:unnamed protein product [Brachionus calyciflorus]
MYISAATIFTINGFGMGFISGAVTGAFGHLNNGVLYGAILGGLTAAYFGSKIVSNKYCLALCVLCQVQELQNLSAI